MYIVQSKTLRSERPLELRWITSTHPIVPDVLQFLRENFHPNEPLGRSIGLMHSERNCKTLDEVYRLGLRDNSTVIALDPESNNIVGVLINSLLRKGEPDDDIQTPNWNPTQLYDKFLKLMVKIHEDLDLFKEYPHVERILDHGILSVVESWRGEGVSQRLVQFSNDVIAKSMGCGMALAICSSYYSAKVFERCGYTEVHKRRFREIIEDNVVLYPTEPPHDFITCQILLFGEYADNIIVTMK